MISPAVTIPAGRYAIAVRTVLTGASTSAQIGIIDKHDPRLTYTGTGIGTNSGSGYIETAAAAAGGAVGTLNSGVSYGYGVWFRTA